MTIDNNLPCYCNIPIPIDETGICKLCLGKITKMPERKIKKIKKEEIKVEGIIDETKV